MDISKISEGLTPAEQFQIVKFREELQAATKDQLIEMVLVLYAQDKRKTRFLVDQLTKISVEAIKMNINTEKT